MSEKTPALNPRVREVTERIRERSRGPRAAYLERMAAQGGGEPARKRLSCTNLAHGFAASADSDKQALQELRWPNLAIVTSYNDMLSAHQPYQFYPDIIKAAAHEIGATAQVAGGVP
ncbi:MAG: phosphogluconate dehydratase, partial [Gammaproteobacteria bacterium]|nr:phosphogluconate dehydratase [Gammaproteobacteria bacterium]